jgi:hypothetical protein
MDAERKADDGSRDGIDWLACIESQVKGFLFFDLQTPPVVPWVLDGWRQGRGDLFLKRVPWPRFLPGGYELFLIMVPSGYGRRVYRLSVRVTGILLRP